MFIRSSNSAEQPPRDAIRSAIARAEGTERIFWWRVVAIVAVVAFIASFGVFRVRERSSSVRTAYKLARLHDALREQVEFNRRIEADLTGKKDPTRLREEGLKLKMRTPQPDETWEIPLP